MASTKCMSNEIYDVNKEFGSENAINPIKTVTLFYMTSEVNIILILQGSF